MFGGSELSLGSLREGSTATGCHIINSPDDIARQIAALKCRLAALDLERSEITERLRSLEHTLAQEAANPPHQVSARDDGLTDRRQDRVVPEPLPRAGGRVSAPMGESEQWQSPVIHPSARMSGSEGVCGKPQVKCGECPNRDSSRSATTLFGPTLPGEQPEIRPISPPAIYPMLPDETCWFLAADFDKKSWMQDIARSVTRRQAKGVPVAIERSRSGNGAHAWNFFDRTGVGGG